MLLSIIIVAYNNGMEIANCLNSIYTYNDLGNDLEVIVVDNSSNPTTEKHVKQFPDVRYIQSSNMGFGHGNNVGFHHSSGKYLLFLNPDTLILSKCFKTLIDSYANMPDIGYCGVRLVDSEGKENNSYNVRLNFGFAKKILLHLSRLLGFFVGKAMYTSGADIFIERTTFAEIGLFDENIFLYGEEEDLSFRLDRIHKKIVYFSRITICHLQGKSSGHNYQKNVNRMLDSWMYICQKYGFPFNSFIRHEIIYMKTFNLLLQFLGRKVRYDQSIISTFEAKLK